MVTEQMKLETAMGNGRFKRIPMIMRVYMEGMVWVKQECRDFRGKGTSGAEFEPKNICQLI